MDYVVWGTGKKSEILISIIKKYESILWKEAKLLLPNILYFIDMNHEKKQFHGFKVKHPDRENVFIDNTACIIAVEKWGEIKRQITENYGINCFSRIVFYRDYLVNLHQNIVDVYNSKIEIEDPYLLKDIKICKLFASRYDQSTGNDKINYSLMLSNYTAEEITEAVYFYSGGMISKTGLELLGRNKTCKNNINTVMFVVHSFSGGGAEKVVSNLIPILIDKGYDCVLVTEICQDGEYSIDPRVHRINIDNSFELDTYRYFFEYSQVVRENKIDIAIIHIPYSGYNCFYKVFLFKMLGIPVIIECHTSINNVRRQLDIDLTTKIYRNVDKLVVLSEYDKTKWNENGIDSVVIPNPIDMSITLKRKDGGSYCRRRLLFVGRINFAEKNNLALVFIMREVVNYIPDTVLDIIGRVGSKNDYDELFNKIVKFKLERNIVIHEFESDIRQRYEDSDIMIMTSPDEGFPMALYESKAFSLPVVMYDIPHLDFVRDGRGIITVPQNDYKAAANNIIKLLVDNEYYNNISKAAGESFLDFSRVDIGEKWTSVIRDIEKGC